MDQKPDKDQRTENATPEQIRKSREEGRIGFSSEFIAGVSLATGTLFFYWLGNGFASVLCDSLRKRLSFFEPFIVDSRLLATAVMSDTMQVGIACCAFLIPVTLIAAASGLVQTQFNLSLKPLNLDWNRLNPVSGAGRIFTAKNLFRGLLAIVKTCLISGLTCLAFMYLQADLVYAGLGSFGQLIFSLRHSLFIVAMAGVGLLFVTGVIDLGYQKWKHLQDLKMSPREIKDEHKSSEGDPLVRARVRKLQMEMSKKRMLSNVDKASVIITNPTHFAVALQYDPLTMDAPVVIAKGSDHLARKIIEIAKQKGIAIVERKPVARYLYANVDIGSVIPIELYQAVAEVLNFVQKLQRGM